MPALDRRSLLDGRIFVLVVVIGGLLTLHGSTELDAPKILYFTLATASVLAAAATAPMWLPTIGRSTSMPWLVATGAILALLAISLIAARAEGTPPTSWLRDVSSYALVAAAPLLALACVRTASRRWLVTALVFAGGLASVSFAVEWISRRRLTDLPIDRIALPSETLAAALLAMATALALVGAPRKWIWAAIGGTVLGLLFITGSRSTLLLLVVPAGAALFAGRPWRGAAPILLVEIAMAVAVFFAGEFGIAVANGNITISLLPAQSAQPGAAAATATKAPDRLGQRVTSVATLITDPGGDQSLQERLSQTRAAWDAFVAKPLLGVGPGYTFHSKDYANRTVGSTTLDTPLIYLAKFGLLGLVPLGLFAAAYLRLMLALRRLAWARMEYLTLIGFTLAMIVVGVQNFPIEDKGSSLALILLIALGLHGLGEPPRSGDTGPADASGDTQPNTSARGIAG